MKLIALLVFLFVAGATNVLIYRRGDTVQLKETFSNAAFHDSLLTGILDGGAIGIMSFDPWNVTNNGWGELYAVARTSSRIHDETTYYALGYAEGYITRNQIEALTANLKTSMEVMGTPLLPEAVEFVLNNTAWMNEECRKPQYRHDRYWYEVRMNAAHMEGLFAGYNAASAAANLPPLNDEQKALIAAGMDIQEIIITFLVFPPALQQRTQATRMPVTQAVEMLKARRAGVDLPFKTQTLRGLATKQATVLPSHCSVLFKLSPDHKDCWMAHNTWTAYNMMSRMYKHFRIMLREVPGVGYDDRAVSFSSYPGLFTSADDFYITQNGLTVIETTISPYNVELYAIVAASQGRGILWTCVRANIANAMAVHASQWGDVFVRYNSGTYNNQWMVFDAKEFKKQVHCAQDENGHGAKKTPLHDVFYVTEQAPGLTHTEDMTSTLVEWGYWPSFNEAYFADIAAYAGYPPDEWDTAFRSLIFKRDAPNVKTYEQLKSLIVANHYQTDPLAEGDPVHQLAARGDLRVEAVPGGMIDAKITSVDRSLRMIAEAVAGPTHDSQPVFCWSTSAFPDLPHADQPDCYPFPWVTMCPDRFNPACVHA